MFSIKAAELVILILTFIPHISQGEIEVMQGKTNIQLSFVQTKETIGGDVTKLVYDVNAINDEGSSENMVFTFADNGLYRYFRKGNVDRKPVEIDLLHYYQQITPKQVAKKRQQLKDKSGKLISIVPRIKYVTIKSPQSKMTFKIPRRYFIKNR